MENINIFGYLGAGGGGGASIIRLGPSWFTSTLSFILICMSNIEAIYDKNLLSFKIKINIFFFFLGHVGPLHKIQGYQGHQNVSPHRNGDICTTRGNNLKTSFSYRSQNVTKNYILGYLGGPEGVFNDQTGPILLSSYPLTHTYVHVLNVK